MMTPSEFLAARKRAGLNQEEAAKLGAVCWTTLMRYERNRLPRMYPKTAQKLKRVYDVMHAMPKREPKRRGRPPGPPKSAAEIDQARIARKLKFIHKSEAEDDRELTAWHKLHEVPKRGMGTIPSRREPLAFQGHDLAWLKRQSEAWLKSGSMGIVIRDRQAYFVIDGNALFDIFHKLWCVMGGENK